MSRTSQLSIIDHLLSVATVRLFQAIDVAARETAPDCDHAHGPVIASTMGFTNDGLRGAVTMVLDRATLAGLHPDVDLAAIETQRDACGELTNMLVGELKRQLRSLGVTVQLGLPVAFAGEGLRLCPPWAGDARCQAFATPHGIVRVRLDVQLAELTFTPEHERAPAAAAGDALFF